MSHGTTCVISPNAIASIDGSSLAARTHRIWWQICVAHVVPHLGYVTTNTSVGLGTNPRPFATDDSLCIKPLRCRMSSSGVIAASSTPPIARVRRGGL